MYNLRYHIVTIVAVFLALALGIFMGSLIGGEGSGVGQRSLIASMRTDFTNLRAENSDLKKSNKAYEEFSEELTRIQIAEKLTGRSIVVLGTNNRAAELARTSIEQAAGAAVPIVVDWSKYVKGSDGELDALIRATRNEKGIEDDAEALALALVSEWKTELSGEATVTAITNRVGVTRVPAGFKLMNGLVNTAIVGDRVDELGLEITKACLVQDIPVAAASVISGNSTLAVNSWEEGVPSTNMLGSSIGSYSLTAFMLKAEPGLYGTFDRSKALAPRMP